MFLTLLKNCYRSDEMELAEIFYSLSVLLILFYKKYC